MRIIDPPLLPARVSVPDLPSVSFYVPKLPNPMLEKMQHQVTEVGLEKAIRRTQADLAEAIDLANRRLKASARSQNMQFIPDAASGMTIIRLIDQRTGEVVKQYPVEAFLENAALLQAAGMAKSVIG